MPTHHPQPSLATDKRDVGQPPDHKIFNNMKRSIAEKNPQDSRARIQAHALMHVNLMLPMRSHSYIILVRPAGHAYKHMPDVY